jgi:hypothetical protein
MPPDPDHHRRANAIDRVSAAADARDHLVASLEGCDAANLATLVRIAAGTYPWRDAIADPPEAAADVAADLDRTTRRDARGVCSVAIRQCTLEGPAAADVRAALVSALSRDDAVVALSRLLEEPDGRPLAFEVVRHAPSPPMRGALEPFARHDRAARWAILAIDDLPVPRAIPDAWHAWLASAEPAALVAVTAGEVPSGAPPRPDDAGWLEIRRAAAEAARVALTRGPSGGAVDDRVRQLLDDPDPEIRREALRIEAYVQDPAAGPRVRELAARERDPKVQLAAIEAAELFDRATP